MLQLTLNNPILDLAIMKVLSSIRFFLFLIKFYYATYALYLEHKTANPPYVPVLFLSTVPKTSTVASSHPSKQPKQRKYPVFDPRVIDPSTPLPSRCRTFRLSEIPRDMDATMLRDYLDALNVGNGCIEENSQVLSLAMYGGSWQVASVSFQYHEPDIFKGCKPDQNIYLSFPMRRIEGRAVPLHVTVDCDFYGMTPFYQSPGATIKYE
jgi:hypothetical protein